MKTISRYIMTLLLLITAATGAWAGVTSVSVAGNWLNPQWDPTTNQMAYNDGVYSITFSNMPAGQDYEFKFALNNSWNESYGYSSTTAVELNKTLEVATQSGVDTNIKFDLAEACDVTISFNLTEPRTFMISTSGLVIGEDDKAPIKVAYNTAKTEASFKMPQYDVTATYTIKRDISVDVTATMGDGTDGVRYRVKKSEQVPGKYEPAEMNMMQVLGLVAVNDGIEQKALTLNQDYFCRIYKLDEQTQQPAGDGVELADFDFAPGLYALKAFAEKGSNYDGETALSNTFQLFEGYQVEVAAKEFITYYKDEPLYVEDEDAVLYTISSVNGDQAVLSDRSDAMPSNTPMLVYNKSNETKTFLLIPCAEPDMDITVAPEFVGTLEATTIAASTDDQTNYALNGKQFVWVKNAVEIGANKAWLSISNSNARAISFVFDETTGLSEELRVKSEEFATATWYTLDGRKIAAPTKKGIYIMNGRKVVVK